MDGIQQLREECLTLLEVLGELTVFATELIVLLGKVEAQAVEESLLKLMENLDTKQNKHTQMMNYVLTELEKDMDGISKYIDSHSEDYPHGRIEK